MKLSSMRKPTADSFSSLVTRVALSLDPVAFWYRMKLSFMRDIKSTADLIPFKLVTKVTLPLELVAFWPS